MTATGEWTIAPIEWAKNTPFPSGATIEYATNRSSPTVATDGGGRLQPVELTSVVSMAVGLPHVFPESAELAMKSAELLSRRTFHHAENARTVPNVVRSDVEHRPGAAGALVAGVRS